MLILFETDFRFIEGYEEKNREHILPFKSIAYIVKDLITRGLQKLFPIKKGKKNLQLYPLHFYS